VLLWTKGRGYSREPGEPLSSRRRGVLESGELLADLGRIGLGGQTVVGDEHPEVVMGDGAPASRRGDASGRLP
jgi:hypothetical protein